MKNKHLTKHFREMSVRSNVRSRNCPFGELSFEELSVGDLSVGEMSVGELSQNLLLLSTILWMEQRCTKMHKV